MKIKILSLAVMTILAGCSFAPNYQTPNMPVPKSINVMESVNEQDSIAKAITLLTWEDFFTDSEVKQLIKLSLENNKDIVIAAGKVAEVRGQYQVQRSEIIPSVGLGGNGETVSVNNDITRQYTAGANVSYELDFWGRVRNLNKVALDQYLSSIENERLVKISVIAETANAYYNWVTAKQTLDLSELTLKSREKSRDLMAMRLKSGINSSLDYTQTQVAVASIQAQIAQSKQQLAIAHSNLELLVGKYDLTTILSQVNLNKKVSFNMEIPDNLNSDVLLGRPDVIAAELNLRSSNAQIGAARAAFFPKVSFVGSYGVASNGLNDLFGGGSAQAWSFLPSITIPLFGNGVKAGLDVAEARKVQSVANYEKTIQQAFAEVYQYSISDKMLEEQLSANNILVATQQKRLNLTKAQYNSGLVDYFQVLSAQESLFNSQLQLLTNKNAKAQSNIYLYKALGGGTVSENSPAIAKNNEPTVNAGNNTKEIN